MAHDVFIGYASAQQDIARQIADKCKASGVRCWMAPFSVRSAAVWTDAITEAITSSRLMLALISEGANKSLEMEREVSEAVKAGIPILPVRVENLLPSPRLRYWLGDNHWFDAFERPFAQRYNKLANTVKMLLSGERILRQTANTASSSAPSSRTARPGEAPATYDLQSLKVNLNQEAGPPPDRPGRYDVRMNSQRPGCLILLIDQSGSMNKRIAGTDIPKRQAVADAVNGLLYQAVIRATADEGVRHRFDIGVLGYGIGEEGVKSAFGKDLAPINEIAEIAKPPQRRVVYQPDGHGGVVEQAIELPIWFEPVASGQTLMYAAFQRALIAAKGWTRQHQDSFPPIVINITDGGFTEKDPTPLVFEIQELTTEGGNSLVFNCHISETDGAVVMYPGPSAAATFDKRMRQLYEMSSMLPELMSQRARQRGYNVEPGARGYVLHADAATLIEFLDIGGTRAMDL